MNVLFLTLVKINNIDERGIYTDLVRKFRDEGHQVSVVCPTERRDKKSTFLSNIKGVDVLNVSTLNLQKSNIIEKGIGTLAIEYQYLYAIKKYFPTIKFDLVLYSTPPITFYKIINFVKKRDNAFCYLLLKDIFPQNAVDMQMMKKGGLLHKIFLKKEQKLYQISDAIGCMSDANKKFVLTHNPNVSPSKVEINPNSIDPIAYNQTIEEKNEIKIKYELPLDKKIFVYGGNLGKPQGIDFLLETISFITNPSVFFLVVGSGTEYNRMDKWFRINKPQNAKLIAGLPKYDYDTLLQTCDVGMIFLHKDFTIPNFPSRMLSYLEMKMPVIAATDSSTDVGAILEENKCGYFVLTGDILSMGKAIGAIISDEEDYIQMKENAWQLLVRDYTVATSYDLIVDAVNNKS